MQFRRILIALAVVLPLGLFFWLLPTPETPPPDHNSFAISKVRVFDGERFHAQATVMVRDGLIEAVGAGIEVPDHIRRIDGSGHTLLPGLIDAHVHSFGDGPEQALRFGVTTQLDMFTDHRLLAAARERRRTIAPQTRADVYSAGTLATAPGGHGTQYGLQIPTLDSPAEADAFVAARLAEGSDFIKIVYDDGRAYGREIPTLAEPTLRAVIEAAHARQVLAVVHVSDLAAAREAVAAGADGLVHVFTDREADDAFVNLARDEGVFVIPTHSVIESVAGLDGGRAVARDPQLSPWLPAAASERLEQHFGRQPEPAVLERALASVRRLHEAGVPILAGTDAPNPGTTYGASLHRELLLLTRAGLGNAQALAAATSVPARVFGLSDRGRIAPGLRADLVLVAGDPAEDLTTTRRIARIWKDGFEVHRPKPAAERPPAAPAGPGDARIADFEDGRLSARFGAGWQTTTDRMRGGNSEVTLNIRPGGAAGSGHALRIRGVIREGFAYPWAGAMFFAGERPMAPVDLSGKRELVFWAKGDGGSYQVLLFSGTGQDRPPAWRSFRAGPEWRELRIPLEEFAGARPETFQAILFSGGPERGEFELLIDEVALQ